MPESEDLKHKGPRINNFYKYLTVDLDWLLDSTCHSRCIVRFFRCFKSLLLSVRILRRGENRLVQRVKVICARALSEKSFTSVALMQDVVPSHKLDDKHSIGLRLNLEQCGGVATTSSSRSR